MTAPALPARSVRPGAQAGAAATGSWGMAARAFMFWLVNYRRTWRGSIYSSVLNPVLYLGAMGWHLAGWWTITARRAWAA